MITKMQNNTCRKMLGDLGDEAEVDISEIIKTNSIKAAEILKTYACGVPKSANADKNLDVSQNLPPEMYKVIETLAQNDEIEFKSQQRGESDPTREEKTRIAAAMFTANKLNFLTRFGKHLNTDHVELIRSQAGKSERDEIDLVIRRLNVKDKRGKCARNRRYQALKKLIDGEAYFSDAEMMKRNPLLYDQLVGRYLSDEERRCRDRASAPDTLVKILMEGIERDDAREFQKKQAEEEDDAMEEEDDTDAESSDGEGAPSSSQWGEFIKDERISKGEFYAKKPKLCTITAPERELLREEFVTFMHQSFLDGHDEDFDYARVDDDETLDDLETVGHDEEEKYFDAEEPEDAAMDADGKEQESSEDELDIYMNALNQHPAVSALSNDLKNNVNINK